MKNLFLLGLLALLAAPTLIFSQTAPNVYWKDNPDAKTFSAPSENKTMPTRYRPLRLQLASMTAHLQQAPGEEAAFDRTHPGLLVALPHPDGSFAQYRVWRTTVMHPELAAKYPEIQTYGGFMADSPAVKIRLDMAPGGFHAMTFGGGHDMFISPLDYGNALDYICYRTSDCPQNEVENTACMIAGEHPEAKTEQAPDASAADACGIRHEYSLALAATGEFTADHGGTTASALAAMVSIMNQVNGIYERDMSYRMILVPNNDLLIYTDAATDPYTNSVPYGMAQENQINCTAVIGTANFDIGHVFGTYIGGGTFGIGWPESVCLVNFRASGASCKNMSLSESYFIGLVAHEMGHQFGAFHTYYQDDPPQIFRWDTNAVEPGWGNSILSYKHMAGEPAELYFHAKSIAELGIKPYIHSCEVEVAVANSAPVVTPVGNYFIPTSTPFALTAAATDPDGDVLTYNWEQMDAFAEPEQPSPPLPTNVNGPVFRSWFPSPSPTRYFPNLPDLFANISPELEVLPSVGRPLNFQVTVRDNFLTAGCTAYQSNTVTTVAGAGPFLVTSPNTAVTYAGNSTQTVTWNVAGTTAAPINCAAVNILLTTDGGATFETLAANTPNDGTQAVTMPNICTSTARVWIQCADNIFFDVSNANFTIEPSLPCPSAFAPSQGQTNVPSGIGTLDWADVPGATGYRVYFGSNTPDYDDLMNGFFTAQSSMAIPDLDYNTTYGYRIASEIGSCIQSSCPDVLFTVHNPGTSISGAILWEHNGTSGVNSTVVALSGDASGNCTIPANGTYSLTATSGSNFTVTPTKNINKLNGVTSADVTAIQQHVANSNPLPAPFKRIAADVNKSNSITTADASLLNQALLGNPSALNQITSWRFVPSSYTFPNPNVPWGFPEKITLTGANGTINGQDFKGIKTGDVVSTWANPANFGAGNSLVLNVQDRILQSGEAVEFRANQLGDLAAFQFALRFDPEKLQFMEIQPLGGLPLAESNFGTYNLAEGEIRVVWSQAEAVFLNEAVPVFALKFKVLQSGGKLSETLRLDGDVLPALAYNSVLAESGVELHFMETTNAGDPAGASGLQLLQNRPNPFRGTTAIAFVLPQESEVQLRVFDASGRLLAERKGQYPAGRSEEIFNLEDVSGVLYYELSTPFGVLAKKMTAIEK